jgi:transcriptional regulator
MYLPAHFAEARIDILHALIRAQPFATLVTLSDSGPVADHVPFVLDASAGELGTLRGHIARANPLWRDHPAERDVLAIFAGPQAYVSPSWYPSKAEHGRVVPTWNYVVAHASGWLRVIDDADWVRAQLSQITDEHEAGRATPWRVDDAPPDFIAQQMRAIVGIEIALTKLIGKSKISQNRAAPDRAGVAAGLAAERGDEAQAMASLVARDQQGGAA